MCPFRPIDPVATRDNRPVAIRTDQHGPAPGRAVAVTGEPDIDTIPDEIGPERRAVLVPAEAPGEADTRTEPGGDRGNVAADPARRQRRLNGR